MRDEYFKEALAAIKALREIGPMTASALANHVVCYSGPTAFPLAAITAREILNELVKMGTVKKKRVGRTMEYTADTEAIGECPASCLRDLRYKQLRTSEWHPSGHHVVLWVVEDGRVVTGSEPFASAHPYVGGSPAAYAQAERIAETARRQGFVVAPVTRGQWGPVSQVIAEMREAEKLARWVRDRAFERISERRH